MIVYARRASAVLFSLLRSREDPRPFLLPANVCPIVPIAFRKAGQPYHLLDVEAEGLGLDREACLRHLEAEPAGVAGVLYVRPYGALEDLSGFFGSLRARGSDLLIVDDRCLCEPDPDGTAGSRGEDVILYSTGRAKPVDVGGGGFAHLRPGLGYSEGSLPFDPAAVEAVERAYQAAIREGRPFRGSGGPWLDIRPPTDIPWERYREEVLRERGRVAVHRRSLNGIYSDGLPEAIQLPPRFHGWRFQIRVPAPDVLLDRLQENGLFASRHYASLGRGIFGPGEFPNAEASAASVVNLFNDRYYDRDRAERTVQAVIEHLRLQ